MVAPPSVQSLFSSPETINETTLSCPREALYHDAYESTNDTVEEFQAAGNILQDIPPLEISCLNRTVVLTDLDDVPANDVERINEEVCRMWTKPFEPVRSKKWLRAIGKRLMPMAPIHPKKLSPSLMLDASDYRCIRVLDQREPIELDYQFDQAAHAAEDAPELPYHYTLPESFYFYANAVLLGADRVIGHNHSLRNRESFSQFADRVTRTRFANSLRRLTHADIISISQSSRFNGLDSYLRYYILYSYVCLIHLCHMYLRSTDRAFVRFICKFLFAYSNQVPIVLASPEGVFTDVWNAFKDIAGLVKSSISVALNSISDVVAAAVSNMVQWFVGIFIPGLDLVMSFINSITNIFKRIFASVEHLVEWAEEKVDFGVQKMSEALFLSFFESTHPRLQTKIKVSRYGIYLCFLVIVLWFAYQAGVVASNIFTSVFNFVRRLVGSSAASCDVAVAEGPIDGVKSVFALVLVMLVGAGHIPSKLIRSVESSVRTYTTISGVVNDSLSSILSILPACVTSIIYKYTSPSTDYCNRLNDFVFRAKSAVVFAASPAAIANDDYVKTIANLFVEGKKLIQERTTNKYDSTQVPQSDVTLLCTTMNQLTSICASIVQIRKAAEGRPEPVWLHLFGKAGCGKSYFMSNLTTLMSGLPRFDGRVEERPSVYTIPTTSHFWSGFQQDTYPITVLDEIWDVLKNNRNSQIDYPNMLLTIMSSVAFMPALPALTSSVAGQKGTTFNSTLFTTASNTSLPPTWDGNAAALSRRMKYVYEVIAPSLTDPAHYVLEGVDDNGNPTKHDITVAIVTPEDIHVYNYLSVGLHQIIDPSKPISSSNVIPIALTLDIYRQCWRFRKHIITCHNNTPTEVKTDVYHSLDEVVSAVLSAVESNVVSFIRHCNANSLAATLDVKSNLDEFMKCVIQDSDPEKLFETMANNTAAVLPEVVPPSLVIDPVVMSNAVDIANYDLAAVDAAFDGIAPQVVPRALEYFDAKAEYPGEHAAYAPVAETTADDYNARCEVASELAVSLVNVCKDPQGLYKEPQSRGPTRRMIGTLLSLVPLAPGGNPIKITNFDVKEYVPGEAVNSTYHSSVEPLLLPIFKVASVELLSNTFPSEPFEVYSLTDPAITSIIPEFSPLTVTEFLRLNIVARFSCTTPETSWTPYVDNKFLKDNIVFVLKQGPNIWLMNRSLDSLNPKSFLINPDSRFQKSNADYCFVNPRYSIPYMLLYWNRHADVMPASGQDATILSLVTSNELLVQVRACYNDIIVPKTLEVEGLAPLTHYCYCSKCLRVFKDEKAASLTHCFSPKISSEHATVPLSPSATTVWTALESATASIDYTYRCAMFWIICARTFKKPSVGYRFNCSNLKCTEEDLEFVAKQISMTPTQILAMANEEQSIPFHDAALRELSDVPIPSTTGPLSIKDRLVVRQTTTDQLPTVPSSTSFLSWLGVGALTVAAVSALVSGLKSYFKPTDDVVLDWAPDSAPPQKTSSPKKVQQKSKMMKGSDILAKGVVQVDAEGEAPSAPTIAVLNYKGANLYGFMPMERYFITYAHGLLSFLDDVDESVILTVYGKREQSYRFGKLRELIMRAHFDVNNDFAVITLPTTVQAVPNRLKCFVTDANTGFVSLQRIAFLRLKSKDFGVAHVIPHLTYSVGVKGERMTFLHDTAISYPVLTSPGDCGHMIMCTSGPCANMIVGMHVAHVTNQDAGAAVFVTREYVVSLCVEAGYVCDKVYEEDEVIIVDPEGPATVDLSSVSGPNLLGVEVVKPTERVNMPARTAYVPTGFIPHKDYPFKEPAIMSENDPRANGKDPLVVAIDKLAKIENPAIDESLLNKCRSEQLFKLKRDLNFPLGVGELSMYTAIRGVPRFLAPINLSSSAGYPLCFGAKLKGKKSYIRICEDGVHVDKVFKDCVEDIRSSFLRGDRTVFERYPFVWLAYEKDELRPLSKIASCSTRLIYCNSLLYTVVFRMLFGKLLCAFNQNAGHSIFSTGININSTDMQMIADQLHQVSDNLIVGDYSGFDQHYHASFQRAAYDNMYELLDCYNYGVPKVAWDMFVEHELSPIVQVKDKRFTVAHSHFSGCFFTTPENCMVNELYFMYCFYRICPDRNWTEDCQFVSLGDDHMVAVSEECPEFNAISVCEAMKELGQVYTDARKEKPSCPYESFATSTFLGSSPVLIGLSHAGALRLDTLYGNCGYVKKETNIEEYLECLLDLASVHPENVYNEFYEFLSSNARRVYGIDLVRDYSGRRQRQIARTAASGASYTMAFAEGPTMNTIVSENTTSAQDVPAGTMDPVSIKSSSMDLNIGADSFMRVGSFTWSSTDVIDKELWSARLPGDLITTSIMQAVPFQYSRFWRGDVELTFQINGTPFMAGGLVVYFNPLKDKTYTTDRANVLTGTNLIIQPLNNDTASFTVKFRHYNDYLETDSIVSGYDILGTVHVRVLSPLASASAISVPVTVWARFPNSEFYAPREPFSLAYAEGPKPTIKSLLGMIPGGEMLINGVRLAHGVAKNADKLLRFEFEPLDHTPVSGGTQPFVQTLGGASQTDVPYATVSASLTKNAFYARGREMFDPAELKTSWLMSRPGILTTLTWNDTFTAGTELYAVNMNSLFGLASENSVPMNIAVLNSCMFWHADVVFDIYVFKTRFHSGRLRMKVNYDSDVKANANYLYSQVIDVNDEVSVHSVRVPWNYTREFMRTYYNSNESLGMFVIEVLNPLVVSSDAVAKSIQLVVAVRFENAKIATPWHIPPYGFGRSSFSMTIPQVQATAEGPDVDDVVVSAQPVVPMTGETSAPEPSPMTSGIPDLFEDVMQVCRRLRPVPRIALNNAGNFKVTGQLGANVACRVLKCDVSQLPFAGLYSGYCGGMRIRSIGPGQYWSFYPDDTIPLASVTGSQQFIALSLPTDTAVSNQVSMKISELTGSFENGFPTTMGRDTYYIDLTCPYQSVYNFIPATESSPGRSCVLGRAWFYRATGESSTYSIYGTFQWAAGDDALFGVFNPPAACQKYSITDAAGTFDQGAIGPLVI